MELNWPWTPYGSCLSPSPKLPFGTFACQNLLSAKGERRFAALGGYLDLDDVSMEFGVESEDPVCSTILTSLGLESSSALLLAVGEAYTPLLHEPLFPAVDPRFALPLLPSCTCRSPSAAQRRPRVPKILDMQPSKCVRSDHDV